MAKVVSIQGENPTVVVPNPWEKLREFTSARIALGRAGNSIPTGELLSFQLDHAKAMDAVHCALDIERLVQELAACEVVCANTAGLPVVVNSKITDRFMYLQRPDLGRQLNEASWQKLVEFREADQGEYDLAIVIADGLSSTAIQSHAVPVVQKLISQLSSDESGSWSIAPVTVVHQGRVASGDDVGECLKARIVMILIGERPGLTSPDSMGIYMTWAPKRGAKESSRNCISNIRPEGLNYDEACNKAFYLLRESRKLQTSGISLKDRSVDEEEAVLEDKSQTNFLLSLATN